MIVWFLTVWLTAAHAAEPACDPLSEADLADRIHASLDAINRADIDGHQAIIRDLEERLPCLEFVPKPERWAELLVGIAIVEHASDGNWEPPLTTAVHIHPKVDLLVGPTHPFRQWTSPAPASSTGKTVPEGVRVYLDGELIVEIPEISGYHLAQRRTGDGWTTLLLQDEEIPENWLVEPSLAKSAGWNANLQLGLRGGADHFVQTVDPAGSWLPDTGLTDPAIGIQLRGSVGLTGLPGLYVDAVVPELPTLRWLAAHGGFDVPIGPVSARAGAGIQGIHALTGGEDVNALLFFPTLGAQAKFGTTITGDGGASVGYTPTLTRVQATGGATLGQTGARLRIGLEAFWVSAEWVQPGVQREIRSSALGAGASVSGVLGKR